MSVVSLIENGLVYYDDFTDGLKGEWDIYPLDNTRYSVEADGLHLLHGTDTVLAKIDMLTDLEVFVADVRLSYTPSEDGDRGGFIVQGQTGSSIVFDEYYELGASQTDSYNWMRLVRKHNQYTGYWSNDGINWNMAGSVYFDQLAPSIGVFLDGDFGSELIIEEVIIRRGDLVRVINLAEGMKVELLDALDNVLASERCLKHRTFVDLSAPSIQSHSEVKFKFTLPDTTSFEDVSTQEVWAGSSYEFSVLPKIEFEYDDPITGTKSFIEAQPNLEQFLGYLSGAIGDETLVRVRLLNEFTGGTFKDIVLEVSEYLTDYHISNVFIAKDNGGTPGNFVKTLNYTELLSSSTEYLWLSITKQDVSTMLANNLTFGIDLTCKFE